MSLEPEKIYLHDPYGVFEEDGHSGMETVLWSEDRIDENDYEYIRSSQNLPKANAYSLLGEVLIIIKSLYIKEPKNHGSGIDCTWTLENDGWNSALEILEEKIMSISP